MSDPSKNSLPPADLIGQNELILGNILFYCDDITLRKCFLVNHRWNRIAHVILTEKMRIFQCTVPIFIERFKSFHLMKTLLNIESPTFNRSYAVYMAGNGLKGPRAFTVRFLSLLKRSVAHPYYVILMDDNAKIDERFCWNPSDVVNSLRPNLPQDCSVVGLNAHYGVVGEMTHFDESKPKDQMISSLIHSRLFIISGLIFPKYRGVTMTTYRPSPEEINFDIRSDVKALIILSSNFNYFERFRLSSWQANSIFNHYRGHLALGGAQIFSKEDLEWTNDMNADGHFYFVNGSPPYNNDWDSERFSPIVIQFSGPNCRAASLYINREEPRQSVAEELALIEARLTEFRTKLTFRCDSNERYETIGFLFFDHESYRNYAEHSGELNAGVDLFFRTFPKTLITGVLCHATYQHNFVPETNNQMPGQDDELLSSRGIVSFVLISMKKNISL